MIEPTDRSNSPEIISSVMPMAAMPGTAWLVRIEEKALAVRKVLGTAMAKMAKTAANPTAAPASGCLPCARQPLRPQRPAPVAFGHQAGDKVDIGRVDDEGTGERGASARPRVRWR